MRFYNRKGKLYLETYEGTKRVRKSLGVDDTPDNRALMYVKLGGQVDGGKIERERRAKFQQIKNAHSTSTLMSPIKVSSVVDKFLEMTLSLKPTTQRTMRAHMRRVLELLGNPTYIESINKESVLNFYIALAGRGFSRTHTRSLISCLKNFLDFSMTMDYIQANPFFKRRIQTPKPMGKQPLSPTEVSQVLELCKGDTIMRIYLTIAFLTGARVGEILALRRGDIDLERGTIRIERTISEYGEILTPKTDSSNRTISIPASLQNALKAYITQNGIQDALFPNPPGRRLNLRKQWHRLLEQCGITKRRLYCTRHTFASMMLSYGGNLLHTSATLGHNNAQITLSAYAAYIPNPQASFAPLENISLGAYQ
ncbi:tyrosine-type recombinase/integrase [Helicobacter mehlei]|uniref:Site-specific integrase n=1 Tax=Helicobacter mehlei TaxID=2316080 RepID=A0A553UMN7_9HELI|nr:site-specific integrase [Helicobacter mehlei]TSA81482.1 site-specific integrase [Helicobacter mehlei]